MGGRRSLELPSPHCITRPVVASVAWLILEAWATIALWPWEVTDLHIEFFMPQGPQPTEMVGLAELRRSLPAGWQAFANIVMRQPGRRGQDREIDVAIVAPDRIILVDLKHVRGRIENRGGFWYRGNNRLFTSPLTRFATTPRFSRR